ncbi:MAG: hypothetical protein IJP29_00870 [Lachnospiraceae bacterium]|nr:hypothetical protein [Lachnospiraceae bacterium]
MNRVNAIDVLKLHSDFNKENSFLYAIKESNIVDYNLFQEIMDSLIVLSKDTIEKEQIKNVYSIVFWCRSWLDAGWIEKQLGSAAKETLRVYTEIIENALYYLLENNAEEAFWAYNEFLDGRYN